MMYYSDVSKTLYVKFLGCVWASLKIVAFFKPLFPRNPIISHSRVSKLFDLV